MNGHPRRGRQPPWWRRVGSGAAAFQAQGRWRSLASTWARLGSGPAADDPALSTPRTDLAVEAYEMARIAQGLQQLEGVQVEVQQAPHLVVRRIRISSPEAAVRMGKAPGTYVTVESSAFWQRSQPAREALTEAVARELLRLLQAQGISREAPVLVAGLGNWNATPDSLGPRVVGQLLVTRHLRDLLPPEKRGSLRPVAALSPGVLGLTGVETTELVGAVVERIRPSALICVDALAAAGTDRLCSTVQLADTGIEPGAGVGNRRKGLNRQSLGVPVIAMGVPTVIHARRLALGAPALARSAMEAGEDWAIGTDPESGSAWGSFPPLLRGPGGKPRDDPSFVPPPPGAGEPAGGELGGRRHREAGAGEGGGISLDRLIVTPKEIDLIVEDAAEVLAGALNAALHEGVDLDEVLQYLQ